MEKLSRHLTVGMLAYFQVTFTEHLIGTLAHARKLGPNRRLRLCRWGMALRSCSAFLGKGGADKEHRGKPSQNDNQLYKCPM